MTQPPCLVLLPGLLCDEAVWHGQLPHLAFARCLVPSFGALSSLTEMARHVLRVAPEERFALAGHSMGGRVALEVARIAPQRLERLALLDTGVDPIAPGAQGQREREQRLALLNLARGHGMRRMAQAWAAGMVHPSHRDLPVFGEILEMIERHTPAIYEAQITALMARPDARDVLRGLRCPTLLVCGRQDSWAPLSRHEEMHRLCAASRLAVIEHSGHMCTMEQPAAVADALVEWMTG